MPFNEAAIESEIQAKGLNAPRLTPAHIDAQIVGEAYHIFPGTTLTVCALTLQNGFLVVGESAAASPENFNAEIGRKIARDNARNKIWALEGYALKSRLTGGTMAGLVSGSVHGSRGIGLTSGAISGLDMTSAIKRS
jgi:hypothetical protein